MHESLEALGKSMANLLVVQKATTLWSTGQSLLIQKSNEDAHFGYFRVCRISCKGGKMYSSRSRLHSNLTDFEAARQHMILSSSICSRA